MNQKVFVYGTLRVGQSNHSLISSLVKSCVPAYARGWLVDLGPYPAMVEGDGYVVGEVITFDDFAKALQLMDQLEGYVGPNHPNNHYERDVIEVITSHDQMERCFTYRYPRERMSSLQQDSRLIMSGDWIIRDQDWIAYFAYGSCMNRESFAGDVPCFRVVGRGNVSDYRVAFTRYSMKWSGGVADLIFESGRMTEGVVYIIPQEMLESLDRREGAGYSYQRMMVDAYVGEWKIPALTYEVITKSKHEIAPSEDYARTILKGMDLVSSTYRNELAEHMRRLHENQMEVE